MPIQNTNALRNTPTLASILRARGGGGSMGQGNLAIAGAGNTQNAPTTGLESGNFETDFLAAGAQDAVPQAPQPGLPAVPGQVPNQGGVDDAGIQSLYDQIVGLDDFAPTDQPQQPGRPPAPPGPALGYQEGFRGDPNFGNTLLDLAAERKRIQDDSLRSIQQGGGGAPSPGPSPSPDPFRYSPQAGRASQGNGIGGPGTAPVRPPGSFYAPTPNIPGGPGVEAIDQGASLPPQFRVNPAASRLDSLNSVQFTPGGRAFDLSDPANIELPGITTGMVPQFLQGNPYDNQGGSRFAQPGGPFSGSTVSPTAGRRRRGNNLRPGYQSVPQAQHPINQELAANGITPQFIAQARAMRDLGLI